MSSPQAPQPHVVPQPMELQHARGGKLFAQTWSPRGPCIGGVAIVHGLGDHSTRFTEVAAELAKAGFLVAAHDQVGHGNSTGVRGHVPDYAWLLDDIHCLIEALAARVGSGPLFLYGQSLGGSLVLNYALRRQNRLAGIIATSPLLLPGSPPGNWKLAAAKFLRYAWPSFTFATGIEPRNLSHDPAVVAAYSDDPLVHGRVSARLATEMLHGGHWALQHADQLALPALLMHGSADVVTCCEASAQFAGRAGPDCTLKIWPDLKHELHWERERQDVIHSMVQWLNLRTGEFRSAVIH